MYSHSAGLPDDPGWVVAAPSYGGGFVSTAFRVRCFKKDARIFWSDFVSKLKATDSEEVTPGVDIDASGLRLQTLQEVADEYVKNEVKSREEDVDSSDSGSPRRAQREPRETADDSASNLPEPREAPATAAEPAGSSRDGNTAALRRSSSAAVAPSGEDCSRPSTASQSRSTLSGREQPALNKKSLARGRGSRRGRQRPSEKSEAEGRQSRSQTPRLDAGREEGGNTGTDRCRGQPRAAAGIQENTENNTNAKDTGTDTPESRDHSGSQREGSGAELQQEPLEEESARHETQEELSPSREVEQHSGGQSGGAQLPWSLFGMKLPLNMRQDEATMVEWSSSEGTDSDGSREMAQHPEAMAQRVSAAGQPDICYAVPVEVLQQTELPLRHHKKRIESLLEASRPSKELNSLMRHLWLPHLPRFRKRGRNKTLAGPAKKQKTLRSLGFGGHLSSVEEQRKKAFAVAARELQSASELLSNPIIFQTPFSARLKERVPLKRFQHTRASEEPPLGEDEVILRVAIREFDAVHATMQEFLVLGSQRLSELRDKIECPADRNMRALNLAVQGAFFYIEGAFYLDTRFSRAEEYSRPIIAFCREHDVPPPQDVAVDAAEALPVSRNSPTGPGEEEDAEPEGAASFREISMNYATWEEVATRAGPGARYVYCHQGCCEHLLVIRDVRLIHPDDPQYASAYPACILEEPCSKRLCDVCSKAMAVHVTYDDKFALADPSFWCSGCYRMMHYDRHGTLQYNHKVFPYQSG